MRRTVALVGLWFLAGAVAVGAASAGVGVVSRELTGRTHPAPMSADQVAAEVAAAATSSTTTPAGGASTTTTSVAPSTTTTTTARGATTSTTTPPVTSAPAPITKSYQLIGGSATLRFSPGGVTVVVATPKPGFTVEVEGEGSGVRVEFESETHKSRLDAWWDGGPQAEVREDADD